MAPLTYNQPQAPVTWSQFFAHHAPQQVLLVARPNHYAIPPADKDGKHANHFAIEGYERYKADPKGFVEKAISQWDKLCATFTDRLGIELRVMPGIKDRPDLVFTADPSLSINDGVHGPVTIYSRFQNEQRQNETDLHVNFMKQALPERVVASSYRQLEGTGDNVYDPYRDLYWCGYLAPDSQQHASAGRSNREAHCLLTDMTGIETVSLAVQEPYFHIDTSLGFLSRGHVLAYPGGMSPQAYETFKYNAFTRYGLDPKEYLIEVSKEDAEKYACNLRCVGNTAVMADCSQELQDKIRSKGYEVIMHDMSQYIASGGAVHCVTNNLNETRIPGGYHKLVQTGLLMPDHVQVQRQRPTYGHYATY